MKISCNPAIVTILTQLPQDICDIIVRQYRESDYIDAHVQYWKEKDTYFDKSDDPVVRSTKVHWIPQHEWLAGMIYYYIKNINDTNFKYDITGFSGKHLQFSAYNPGDHYDWHTDEPRNLHYMISQEETKEVRKLSFSLQLSDPSSYEGGELVFRANRKDDEDVVLPREVGTLVVFDSRMEHKVNPVISGVRYALVGWMDGPVWR